MSGVWGGIGIGMELLRRKVRKKLKEAGAISKETAKTAKDIGIDEKTLKGLKRWKKLKHTVDGRYYFDCEDEKHC